MLTARTAGSTLVFLAAFAALLHSDAALAADPADVSQHHHTANIVFGEQLRMLRRNRNCRTIL